MHKKGGAEHGRVKVGAANRTWPTQDGKRKSESEGWTGTNSVTQDMRQAVVESCALDGERYMH